MLDMGPRLNNQTVDFCNLIGLSNPCEPFVVAKAAADAAAAAAAAAAPAPSLVQPPPPAGLTGQLKIFFQALMKTGNPDEINLDDSDSDTAPVSAMCRMFTDLLCLCLTSATEHGSCHGKPR